MTPPNNTKEVQAFIGVINYYRVYVVQTVTSVTRGRTDKKLTSTLVIRTFLSFELADIFKSMGLVYFSKRQKKLRFPSSSPTTTQTLLEVEMTKTV